MNCRFRRDLAICLYETCQRSVISFTVYLDGQRDVRGRHKRIMNDRGERLSRFYMVELEGKGNPENLDICPWFSFFNLKKTLMEARRHESYS